MLREVRAFHRRHDLKNRGGEDLEHRVALMVEELGEKISACVTKGRDASLLAEECADLFILLLGTAISADLDLKQAFWDKMEKLKTRQACMVGSRVRVSNFSAIDTREG